MSRRSSPGEVRSGLVMPLPAPVRGRDDAAGPTPLKLLGGRRKSMQLDVDLARRERTYAADTEHRRYGRAATIAYSPRHRGFHQIRFFVVANPEGSGPHKY
jgi:hypothetical protein